MWIENSYGNIWQALPDVVVDAASAGAVKAYVKSAPPYSVASIDGYTTLKKLDGTDLLLPGASGYKGAPAPGQPLHSGDSTGDSTKFSGDNFWVTITAALRGVLVGGSSNDGSTAGAAAWRSNHAASDSYSNIGSRAGFQEGA
jgi:hypothetical protein